MHSFMSSLLFSTAALIITTTTTTTTAFSLSSKPVSQLLSEKSVSIAALKEQAVAANVDITKEPYANDVFFLRYCLNDDDGTASTTLASNLAWRQGEGKSICDAAQSAIVEATTGSSTTNGRWNNDAVSKAAPSSNVILNYLTPANILTTTTSNGDLCTCICAGFIDDVEMMGAIPNNPQDMIDFFVYAKEVNAAVCNTRSVASDTLHCIITANSLEGVKLVGGDASFRTALSSASKVTDPLYPNLSGPTLLLNLPRLLGALVKLFTPLFPPAVKERLRFESGPLKGVTNLMDITTPNGPDRAKFMAEIDDLVY